MNLVEYVISHTDRTECKCGQCFMPVQGPEEFNPHTADMIFFRVSKVGEPKVDEFKKLIAEWPGEFGSTVNPLDGKDHSYLELGGWIGDQGIAMQFMGLGVLLGIFNLLTPVTLFKMESGSAEALEFAGLGLVAVIIKPPKETRTP